MRRILLLGKDGQLGWELQRSLVPLGQVTALGRGAAAASSSQAGREVERKLCGDLTCPVELAATVRSLAPDIVVNAAAYTAVDKAETDEEAAHAVNAVAPSMLAQVCLELGALLVHFSTDYVFDGTGIEPWREADPTGPLSVYGRTKLEGEECIRASGCRHIIIRTSWVYATRGTNFPRTILRLAKQRTALDVVDDQVGAPTGADLLADVTAHAVRATVSRPELDGTYHVAAKGETSWFGYARFVVELALARGWSLRLSPDGLLPIPTSAYPQPARRPINSRLGCEKFERAFSLCLPNWQNGIRRLLEEIAPA